MHSLCTPSVLTAGCVRFRKTSQSEGVHLPCSRVSAGLGSAVNPDSHLEMYWSSGLFKLLNITLELSMDLQNI